MEYLRRALATCLVLSIASAHSLGEQVPVVKVERVTVTTDSKGKPVESTVELGLRAEFPVARATLLYRSGAAEYQEFPLHRDTTLRYVAKVPFAKSFEYQVRVTPEQGSDIRTQAALYDVKELTPAKRSKATLQTVIVVLVAIVGLLAGLGVAKRG
jgi:hypothetical protein